jgi:hypothetical protein
MASYEFTGSKSRQLREELCARNIRWAEDNAFEHERTMGVLPSVLYRPDEEGRHGNFYPASYQRILRDPGWKRRLEKIHTTARRHTLSHDAGRCELDSCNSSDALLMNIFCHPTSSAPKSDLRAYLAIDPDARFLFGHKPRVPIKGGRVDCTEVDLFAGDLLLEAKLTESDFQSAGWEMVHRYEGFETTFEADRLPGDKNRIDGYQLVRGILAAANGGGLRYALICDERRADLVGIWFQVVSAIRRTDVRCRCVLVTWQELSRTLPGPLRRWLREKYGIESRVKGWR